MEAQPRIITDRCWNRSVRGRSDWYQLSRLQGRVRVAVGASATTSVAAAVQTLHRFGLVGAESETAATARSLLA